MMGSQAAVPGGLQPIAEFTQIFGPNKTEKYLCCVNTSGAWQLLATQSSPDDRSGGYQPNISCPSAAPPYQPL